MIVLDVGASMNQAPAGEATSLQTSLDAINMILQRKVSSQERPVKLRLLRLHVNLSLKMQLI